MTPDFRNPRQSFQHRCQSFQHRCQSVRNRYSRVRQAVRCLAHVLNRPTQVRTAVLAGILALGLSLLPTPWRNQVVAAEAVRVELGDGGMVVSDSAVASRIGRDVLIEGGSAVDAAVATAFALAVSWPEAGNIGGGGFMMVRPSDGTDPVCIDYRETAPLAATETSFTRQDTTYTQKAAGVPGTVRGLAAAHAKYGKLPWERVVMPAATLAIDGVLVDEALAQSLNSILEKEDVQSSETHAELRHVYGKADGQPWQPGDRLVLSDLSQTLTEIAQQGPDAFYGGRVARLIVEEMKRGDGLISLEDLRQYTSKIRPVLTGTYRGYTILGAPPPSSGGTSVIEALNILEHLDLASRDRFDPLNVHMIAESLRRAFADRARYLGDPDFVEIPSQLTDKDYAKELAASINFETATTSQELAPEIKILDESPSTTHFSVIDADGMAVSNTYTLEASWGSRVVVRNAGFVLNNEMGDFNWFPGVTTRSGQIGTSANTIAPKKRMLSSQAPTIVEKDGKVVLVTGSPGGRTIISTIVGIIVNMVDFDMNAADAIAAPRMHHGWFPNQIELERLSEPPHSLANVPLRRMRHVVKNRDSQGSAHSIALDRRTGMPIGIADSRRGGRPAGIASQTIALWDFADAIGTELSTTQHIGELQWSGNISGSVTDGQDHFHIRRDAPLLPMRAYLDLKDLDLARVSVEVTIDSAEFAGRNPNEQLRVSFTHGTVIPRVTARMVFGHTEQNTIILRGEASRGGTAIQPVVISENNQLTEPIVLRLELDTDADTYRIATRGGSEVDFTFHGMGKLAPERDANYLGLNALNDFSAEGEYLNIDRVEVRKLD